MRSDRKIFRSLWIGAVVVLLSMCTHQCYMILSEYFAHPKTTSLHDEAIPVDQVGLSLPDVLLCNLNPFSSEAKDIENIPTVEEYRMIVENMTFFNSSIKQCRTTQTGCDKEVESMFHLGKYMKSNLGYFSYIGHRNAGRLGHTAEQLISQCLVAKYFGPSIDYEGCSKYVEFKLVPHPVFFQCVDIQFKNVPQDIIGLALILYLDNFLDPMHGPSWYYGGTDKASGISVTLHQSGVTPLLTSTYAYANGGMLTDIGFKFTTVSWLDEPYGQCKSEREQENDPIMIQNETKKYSQDLCQANCLGSNILEECGCIDIGISHDLFLKQEDKYPYCASAKHGEKRLLENLHCIQNIKDSVLRSCVALCEPPCKLCEYKTNVAAAVWPRPLQYCSFYHNYIKGKSYQWRFTELEKDCNEENCTTMEILKQQYLMQNNFAKLRVFVNSDRQIVYKDEVKMSTSSLLAQLGGVLNLWCGITIVICIEFIECILKIVLPHNKKKVAVKCKNFSENNQSQITYVLNKDKHESENSKP